MNTTFRVGFAFVTASLLAFVPIGSGSHGIGGDWTTAGVESLGEGNWAFTVSAPAADSALDLAHQCLAGGPCLILQSSEDCGEGSDCMEALVNEGPRLLREQGVQCEDNACVEFLLQLRNATIGRADDLLAGAEIPLSPFIAAAAFVDATYETSEVAYVLHKQSPTLGQLFLTMGGAYLIFFAGCIAFTGLAGPVAWGSCALAGLAAAAAAGAWYVIQTQLGAYEVSWDTYGMDAEGLDDLSSYVHGEIVSDESDFLLYFSGNDDNEYDANRADARERAIALGSSYHSANGPATAGLNILGGGGGINVPLFDGYGAIATNTNDHNNAALHFEGKLLSIGGVTVRAILEGTTVPNANGDGCIAMLCYIQLPGCPNCDLALQTATDPEQSLEALSIAVETMKANAANGTDPQVAEMVAALAENFDDVVIGNGSHESVIHAIEVMATLGSLSGDDRMTTQLRDIVAQAPLQIEGSA